MSTRKTTATKDQSLDAVQWIALDVNVPHRLSLVQYVTFLLVTAGDFFFFICNNIDVVIVRLVPRLLLVTYLQHECI